MSKEKRKRLRPGDMLELETSQGLAYVQLLGKDPVYGDMIKVFPRVFETRPGDLSAIDGEGYVTFYPAGPAASQGLVHVVGRLQLREDAVPRRFRRRSMVDAQGRVLGWFIMEADGTETFRERVSEEESHLPIASIWNHEYLQDRIVEGWRPEMEGGPMEASRVKPVADDSPGDSDTTGARPVSHYLYFSKKKVALEAVREIRERGYSVEHDRAALGDSWLVLVKQSVDPAGDEMNVACALLQDLAARLHGEYDGHEVQVG